MARRKRRRRNVATYVNPRRRRRRARRRYRNPSGGSFMKRIASVAVPSLAAGAALGFVDSKFLSSPNMSPLVKIGAKVGLAFGAGLLLRRRPDMASVAMGAILGTLGYEQGVRFGGGVVATSTPAAMKELAALVSEDPEAQAHLAANLQGMGMLYPGTGPATAVDPALTSGLDVNLG